jgi:hypothetical protein
MGMGFPDFQAGAEVISLRQLLSGIRPARASPSQYLHCIDLAHSGTVELMRLSPMNSERNEITEAWKLLLLSQRGVETNLHQCPVRS